MRKYLFLLYAITALAAHSFGASYTTSSGADNIPAGTYGVVAGIQSGVSVNINRISLSQASGIIFGSTEKTVTGIGVITPQSVYVTGSYDQMQIFGIKMINASQINNGSGIYSNVEILSNYQANGALLLYGNSSTGAISGTYKSTSTGTSSGSYAVGIATDGTSKIGSLSGANVTATGKIAYGIASNKLGGENLSFINGNTITANGTDKSYLLYADKALTLTGDSNVNVFKGNSNNTIIYTNSTFTISSGTYKFMQDTTIENGGYYLSQVMSGVKLILNHQDTSLTATNTSLRLNKGFELDVMLSEDFVAGTGFYAINGSITLNGFTGNDATSAVKLKDFNGNDYGKGWTAITDSKGLFIQTLIPEPSEFAMAMAAAMLTIVCARRFSKR